MNKWQATDQIRRRWWVVIGREWERKRQSWCLDWSTRESLRHKQFQRYSNTHTEADPDRILPVFALRKLESCGCQLVHKKLTTRWGIITGPSPFLLCSLWTSRQKLINFSTDVSGTRTLCCYKQQQHSKLLAQFVFKVSAFRLNAHMKTGAPLPDCRINNTLIQFVPSCQDMRTQFVDVLWFAL